MDHHSNVYQQYCWVLKKNVVFEQTVYHDGRDETRCMYYGECRQNGGCKNRSLCGRLTMKD